MRSEAGSEGVVRPHSPVCRGTGVLVQTPNALSGVTTRSDVPVCCRNRGPSTAFAEMIGVKCRWRFGVDSFDVSGCSSGGRWIGLMLIV